MGTRSKAEGAVLLEGRQVTVDEVKNGDSA